VAGSNAEALARQAIETGARTAVVADPAQYATLRDSLTGTGIEPAAGNDAVVAAASRPVDWVLAAIVGSAGLTPTIAAIRTGTVVALANKESLVCAGNLVMQEVAQAGATLLPVDSEHSAIFQVLDRDHPETVDRITLTASGGPFRTANRKAMATVTPEQAVAHPNWNMGAKISVDSATMMNKGLELIEAHYLFQMPSDRLDILIHPQSVIHSMVSYRDGSVLAQMGVPDMRTPIAYALAWPERMDAPVGRLDLTDIGSLSFEAPDPVRFPALRIARTALEAGDGSAAVLNAANEVGVQAFLERRIGFLRIVEVTEETLNIMDNRVPQSLEDVIALDQTARQEASRLLAT
jgi:1-deoxy-D-xylulose-5-phosphate reductoisomerase